MTYDFGRGSVIRDITGRSTGSFFKDLLRWKGDIAVGLGDGGPSTGEIPQTNEDFIAYKGSVTINDVSGVSLSMDQAQDVSLENIRANALERPDTLLEFMKKYHPNYDGENIDSKDKGIVSLLLNDGTWDIVYSFSTFVPSGYVPEIKTADFKLHYANKDYARTTDGYLTHIAAIHHVTP